MLEIFNFYLFYTKIILSSIKIMSNQIIKINNNDRCVIFSCLNDIIKFVHIQVLAYKKIVNILDDFITLIDNLAFKAFSNIDNTTNSKQIIINAISSINDNLLMIFTSRCFNIQIANLSTTYKAICGYTIKNKEEKCNLQHNISLFINSLRIQYYPTISLIKIIQNNSKNIPNNVFFIGSKLDEINDDNFICILEKIKNNTTHAITKFKVLEMNYIQRLNNLQNIV